ncbi:MAG: ATP-binding protein [Campylobacterota bacterium]|nr:ATP-binding protein [Campylobacterota bacterium]
MITAIKNFYTASIKRQLILGIALVHAVMMSIFVVDLVENERSFLIEQHNKKAKSLSKTLASTSNSWVLANDFIGLAEVVSSLEHYPGVQYIMVTDLQGQVLAHTDKKLVGKYISDNKSVGIFKGSLETKTVFENSNFIDVASPILRDTQHIGWARIALSKDEINKGLYNVTIDGIIYTFIAILVGVIFAYFMAQGVTQGIYKIIKTIKQAKQGDHNSRSSLKRKDEIGTLSKEFDNMLQKLSAQNRLINSVIDSSPDMIFYKDYYNFDGVYIGCNNSFSEFVGKSKEEILGKTDFDIFDKETAEFFRVKDKEMLKMKESNSNEEWVKYPTGDDVLLDTLKTPLYNYDKSLLGVLGISRDITEKYNTQKEIENKNKILFEQSKHAAMGEMIGNIAHQWRQPLSVISTGATGLKFGKEFGELSDEFFNDTCDAINNNAQYLSKTIDDFRDFIKGERKKVVFDLNEDINSFLHLVEGSIKNNNINLIEDYEKPIRINSYPNELIQCFINIFNNSKDVLKDIDTDRYFFITTKTKNEKAVISFKDNAGGIPDDVLPHIFEPYFTTKHKTQGTGLGLSMTYNLIVEGMGGTIEVANVSYEYQQKSYKGASFTITLPLS